MTEGRVANSSSMSCQNGILLYGSGKINHLRRTKRPAGIIDIAGTYEGTGKGRSLKMLLRNWKWIALWKHLKQIAWRAFKGKETDGHQRYKLALYVNRGWTTSPWDAIHYSRIVHTGWRALFWRSAAEENRGKINERHPSMHKGIE